MTSLLSFVKHIDFYFEKLVSYECPFTMMNYAMKYFKLIPGNLQIVKIRKHLFFPFFEDPLMF